MFSLPNAEAKEVAEKVRKAGPSRTEVRSEHQK